MTPLEKAKAAGGRVNYCDECGQFAIVGNGAFCKVDGKLIHPIMLVRGQGTGPAWNCKKRIKPITNYERLIRKMPEEMAAWIADIATCNNCRAKNMDTAKPCKGLYEGCKGNWFEWLKQEVES